MKQGCRDHLRGGAERQGRTDVTVLVVQWALTVISKRKEELHHSTWSWVSVDKTRLSM